MNIRKIEKIIDEEIEAALMNRKGSKKHKRNNKREQEKIYPGYGEMKSYSVGITEKEEKEQCISGNPIHNEDGEFDTKDAVGSWSVSNPDGKADCDYGKLSKKGSSQSKVWVSQPCGRKDRKTPNTKAKFKCKDGSLATEGSTQQTEQYLAGVIQREIEAAFKRVQAKHGCSFKQLLQAMSAWTQASKGTKK